jgi:hypothetical protein
MWLNRIRRCARDRPRSCRRARWRPGRPGSRPRPWAAPAAWPARSCRRRSRPGAARSPAAAASTALRPRPVAMLVGRFGERLSACCSEPASTSSVTCLLSAGRFLLSSLIRARSPSWSNIWAKSSVRRRLRPRSSSPSSLRPSWSSDWSSSSQRAWFLYRKAVMMAWRARSGMVFADRPRTWPCPLVAVALGHGEHRAGSPPRSRRLRAIRPFGSLKRIRRPARRPSC